MESVRAKEVKDRYIKPSNVNLPEHFNTKWELNQELDCHCPYTQSSTVTNGCKRSKHCH